MVEQAPNSTISQVIEGVGPITGLFVVLVVIGLVLLMRSMSRQLRKVDPSLPDGPDDLARRAGEDAIDNSANLPSPQDRAGDASQGPAGEQSR